jgi:AcrR family transcriptional regulator
MSSCLTNMRISSYYCQVRTAAPLRRVPVQARSKRRYEAILDAAAVVFAERGFDATTMEDIAAGANSAIGSLYQFFPDKRAVFQALAERCLERTRSAFEALIATDFSRILWRDAIDPMVDAFAVLYRSDPSFRAVVMNLQLYGLYAESDAVLHRFIVTQIARKLGEIARSLAPAERQLVATMIVTTVATMLLVLQRAQPAAAKAILAETKLMLRQYLGARLGEPKRRA